MVREDGGRQRYLLARRQSVGETPRKPFFFLESFEKKLPIPLFLKSFLRIFPSRVWHDAVISLKFMSHVEWMDGEAARHGGQTPFDCRAAVHCPKMFLRYNNKSGFPAKVIWN